jgi:hypothetical protein
MKLVCRAIGHHRSKRLARPSAGIWLSECKRCGLPMERVGPHAWLPVIDDKDATRISYSVDLQR